MSKSGDKASAGERDAQKADFVYDFLYCDTARIGSILAQFDDAGVLSQLIQRESATTSPQRGYKFDVSGSASFMGTGGGGGIDLERSPGEQGTESSA